MLFFNNTVKPVKNGHFPKIQKLGLQDQLLLNAGHKYCRMLQSEHSAILLTFIKLLFDIKTFVLSIFEWPLKTGFTVAKLLHPPPKGIPLFSSYA